MTHPDNPSKAYIDELRAALLPLIDTNPVSPDDRVRARRAYCRDEPPLFRGITLALPTWSIKECRRLYEIIDAQFKADGLSLVAPDDSRRAVMPADIEGFP